MSSCHITQLSQFSKKNYENSERDWQYSRFFHNCHIFLVQNCDNCEILTIVAIPEWEVVTFVNAWLFKCSWIDLQLGSIELCSSVVDVVSENSETNIFIGMRYWYLFELLSPVLVWRKTRIILAVAIIGDKILHCFPICTYLTLNMIYIIRLGSLHDWVVPLEVARP